MTLGVDEGASVFGGGPCSREPEKQALGPLVQDALQHVKTSQRHSVVLPCVLCYECLCLRVCATWSLLCSIVALACF